MQSVLTFYVKYYFLMICNRRQQCGDSGLRPARYMTSPRRKYCRNFCSEIKYHDMMIRRSANGMHVPKRPSVVERAVVTARHLLQHHEILCLTPLDARRRK